MSDIEKIRQAMTTLEAQRPILGDAVVDASLGALKKQLAELEGAQGAEQRKLVSLLFADLVGFTSMADKLDPEDVHAIQQAYFSAVTAPIRQQGGIIEKYIGDAIVAVFGLPRADEDDPDRAVMAALKMQAALVELNSHLEADLGFHLQRPLQMRIGVNTGLAIVSMKGGNEFEMVGDSVNLASRLQSAAPAGGVLISYDTYRHVRGVFDLQPLEPVTVKGKADPIQVFLVTAAKKRSFRTRKRGVEGIETRMIGREMELMTLQQTFFSALEDRERRAITIVAEPGMGKSRLIYEFENWVDLRPERISVLRGRARMEIQHLPYSLLRDMFSFRFGIQDDDPLPELWSKFELGLQEFKENTSESESRAAVMAIPASTDSQVENPQMRAHFIGELLGYDFSASPHLQAAKDDPAQIQERASAYLAEYFTLLAQAQPILMLLEDLHWGDDASLNMIGRLASRLEGKPVLVLATTRPALYERRQHWMEGQEFHQRLDLPPLSNRDSRRLVEEVLQKVRDIPETLRELVVTNAEGNPFYVEELVKMLIEEGVIIKSEESWQVLPGRLTEIRIPATLTGVLQARLDGLPQVERELIQQASVVGRVFWDQALLQMSNGQAKGLQNKSIHDGLTDLRLKEMVYRRENSVFAGSEELIFKHAMLREVTYASVIKRLRRLYHRLTAEWLVEVTEASGRVDEYTGLIAEHYFQAEELLPAADWLTRAGERAHLQGAVQEAGVFFDRALSLLPAAEGNRRWRAMEGRGAVLMILGQDDLALRAYLEDLMSLARSLENDSHMAEAHLRKAMYIANRGENQQAIREYQLALESAGRAGNRLIEARTLASMAIIHARLGERQAAQSAAESALEAAFQTGDIKIMAKVHNNAAVACMELGDAAKAIRYLSQSIEYEQQVGDIPGMGNTLNNLGYQYLMLGIIEPAMDALEKARSINQGVGARRDLAYAELNIALAKLRAQDPAGALASLHTSTAELADQGDEFGRAAGLTYQGLALEASGGLQEAATCFRQALEIHLSIGFMTYAMDARSGMARCALALGRLEEAQAEAAALWQHLKEHGGAGLEFPVWAYLTCAQVFQAAGQPGQFDAVLTAGHRELMDRAEKISDAEWRRSFLENVPEHRQITALWEAAGLQGSQGQLAPAVSS
jgi:class 3 adenylate cyclase/predicted ATPase